jgi:hypothetical protein
VSEEWRRRILYMMSAQVPVTPQLLLTTAFVLAQSHDPVGQDEGRVDSHLAVGQLHVAAHNHVALILAPGVLGVAFVEAVCTHGRGRAERMHVGRGRKLGIRGA